MRSAPSEFSIACPPSIPMRQEIFPVLKLRSMAAAVVASAKVCGYLRHRRWIRSICSSAYRSEEHTSELQSRLHLVCRLLLEKKKKQQHRLHPRDYSKTQYSTCTMLQSS